MAGKTPMWRRYLTFWDRDVEADLRDEVEFHLEARARELVDAGWAPDAARDEARRVFGDTAPIVSECHRIDRRFEQEQRMTHYLADLREDVRFALRQLRRQPRYWAVIVLTIVVGIAASTSLFAVVDGVLLKPLPYREPDRLVRLTTWNLRGEYVQLRRRATTMSVAAYYPAPREVTVNIGDRPARLSAAGVTANLFDVLGVQPMLGRAFTEEETRPGGPGILGGTFWRSYGIVILSTGVWADYFGKSPAAVGRTMLIEGVPHTVVGVMPPDFHFPSRNIELWFPHNIDPAALWNGNVATTIGRLKDTRTLAEARAEVRALMPTFLQLIPWGRFMPDYGKNVDVTLLSESVSGGARRVLLVLMAAIGVVLLVLGVSGAYLLLAQGATRDREMITRAALGAGRARLARQVIVESLTVALGSGVIGILLVLASLGVIIQFLPRDLPRIEQIHLDARVLLFAVGVSTVTGLVFGLLPAMRASRAGRTLLSTGARGVVGEGRDRRLSSTLAALEFSLAVVLVVSAVLLLQSLRNLTAIDPGFKVERLVAARVAPPGLASQDVTSRSLFTQQLLERLEGLPQVRSAALANAIPFDAGLFGTPFQIEGRPLPDGQYLTAGATFLGVSPRYFDTMGTPVLEGRAFTKSDRTMGPRVTVIGRRIAKAFWGDASPIGSRIRFPGWASQMDAAGNVPWFNIVGVVGDVRFGELKGEASSMLYLPLDQLWDLESYRVIVRTGEDAPSMASVLRTTVSSLDRNTPVSDVRTYESRLGETIARPRFAAYLLVGFAVIAMFLAAIGAYGVLSHTLSRRIPEIGVRLAFGASGSDVFRLLFGHGMRLTLVGVGVGIAGALGATRFLSALLFGVKPIEPVVFAGVAAVLLIVGLGVSYLPARRASRVDPMVALRYE